MSGAPHWTFVPSVCFAESLIGPYPTRGRTLRRLNGWAVLLGPAMARGRTNFVITQLCYKAKAKGFRTHIWSTVFLPTGRVWDVFCNNLTTSGELHTKRH